jgi:predicted metal-dependent hydrolase
VPIIDSSRSATLPLLTQRRRSQPLPSDTTITIDGRDVRIAVRQAPRANRYSLRLPPGGGDPVLTLPPYGRFADALAFVHAHRPWLADRLARRPEIVPFAAGSLIPFRGVETRIVQRPTPLRGATHIAAGPDGPELIVFGTADHVARRVHDFLKREARKDLEAAVALHAGRLQVTPGPVRLKDTRSRWGSCTAKGELSFSWRIIMAPPHVLDYLAAHEVAHIRELNHSARFWRHVRDTCPAMNEGQAWLKRHGARLHLYGR